MGRVPALRAAGARSLRQCLSRVSLRRQRRGPRHSHGDRARRPRQCLSASRRRLVVGVIVAVNAVGTATVGDFYGAFLVGSVRAERNSAAWGIRPRGPRSMFEARPHGGNRQATTLAIVATNARLGSKREVTYSASWRRGGLVRGALSCPFAARRRRGVLGRDGRCRGERSRLRPVGTWHCGRKRLARGHRPWRVKRHLPPRPGAARRHTAPYFPNSPRSFSLTDAAGRFASCLRPHQLMPALASDRA